MQKSEELQRKDLDLIPHPSLYFNAIKQLHTFFRHRYKKCHYRNINRENSVCSDRSPYLFRIYIFSIILHFTKQFLLKLVCPLSLWWLNNFILGQCRSNLIYFEEKKLRSTWWFTLLKNMLINEGCQTT